jgi:hypothetical protein
MSIPSGPSQDGFNIPTNAYARTGMDWENPYVAMLADPVIGGYMGLQDKVSSMSDTIGGRYEGLMRRATGPDMLGSTLNDLASRNILNSSVASDALAKAATQNVQGIADKQFEADLSQISAEMSLPGLGGQLMELGRSTENPLQPYELMTQLLMAR